MHDPTEGGVRAALHEMAFASRVRLDVDLDRIPVFPQTLAICGHYAIDPLGLIGSGALLVALPRRRADGLLRAWARKPAGECARRGKAAGCRSRGSLETRSSGRSDGGRNHEPRRPSHDASEDR